MLRRLACVLRGWRRCAFFLALLLPLTTLAAAAHASSASAKQPAAAKRNAAPAKNPTPHPLQTWMKPLLPGKSERKVTRHLGAWVRTWLAGRWGVRSSKKAYKRWVRIWRYLSTWDPANLHRELRQKTIEPKLYARLRGFRFRFRSPRKGEHKAPRGVGRAAVGIQLVPLPRTSGEYRRPFRMVFTGKAELPRLKPQGLDRTLLNVLAGLGALKRREVPAPPERKPLFASLSKGSFSRKIADFLTVPLPRAARFLDKYMDIREIASPKRGGRTWVNLRGMWRKKVLLREYPRYRKTAKKKYSFRINTDFVDKAERVWLRWFYQRKTLTHTVQALLGPKGFYTFQPGTGKALSGPWRPTNKLRSQWRTRTTILYRSKTFRFELRALEIGWELRPLKNGAQLSLVLLKKPRLVVKGGRWLRRLARVVVSGGVEGLLDRFLLNLSTGDSGRGFRWRMRWLARGKNSIVDLRTTMPMVQDRVLTSALRIASYFGQGGSGSKKGKKRKAPLRRYTLWQRLLRRLYFDLRWMTMSGKARARWKRRRKRRKAVSKREKRKTSP